MECIFCKIVKGEMPCRKVHEDKSTLAFLDINPANPGHVLVIPKKHTESIFEIDEEDLRDTISATKKIATLIKEKLGVEYMQIIQNNGRLAGQLVSHIHFHIIPRFEKDNVIFTYQRKDLSDKDLDEIQKKLKKEEEQNYRRPW